jgi:hypothetical protein
MVITPEKANRVREASRWFANADRLFGAELQEWHRWIADADNRTEYDDITRLARYLRTLPKPPLPSDDELKKSVEQDYERCEP